MKVWKLTSPGSIQCVEITDAETPAGYAKIKISRTGISVSDLNFYRGIDSAQLPLIPGHQAVGIVSEIASPNDAGLEKGQRVMISSFLPCGKCLDCLDGKPGHCSDMKMMGISADGLLRDFAVVPIANLYALPAQISDDEAIFTEHIAMAVHIFHDLEVKKGDHIAVIGASIIGLILAQVAIYHQAIPILVDSSEHHFKAAQDTGIYYLVNTAKEDAVQRIMQITGGRGVERVAYLTSGNENFRHAVDFAGAGGRIAVAGWIYTNKSLKANLEDVVTKRLYIRGVNNGQAYVMVALNILANKAVNVSPLLSKVIPFDEVPEMFKDATENPYKYNKVIVKV